MRVAIYNDDDKEPIFSYVSPETNPGEVNIMCAINEKKEIIKNLAECIAMLVDSQFPIP